MQHAPITERLIELVEQDKTLKALLEHSIELAAQQNPDSVTNPSQDLESLYSFIDWAAKALPWQIAPWAEARYSTLFDQIDQGLSAFYFVFDQELPELKGKHPYRDALQYIEPIRSWLIDFMHSYGQFLSTPESWCDEYLQRAKADPLFRLNEGLYEDESNWHSFNDFFSRRLSSPNVRPIAHPDDEHIVVCPADSEPQGVWEIDEDSYVISNNPLVIKSGELRSVDSLVASPEFAGAFAGGTLTHTFLNVHNYHRYHFPVSGVIRELKIIPGDVGIGGVTQWDPNLKKYYFVHDDTSWQSFETRSLVIVETDKHGLVALLPVGMSQVSSVNFEPNLTVGQRVEKGDSLGYFLFGGSDYVMIFQKGANFTMACPMTEDGTYEPRFMGQEYGRLA